MKNPGVAAVLSFFISGLGQIYNGQIVKGLIILGVQVFNAILTVILIGFITGPIVWIWAIYDAYSTAKKLNEQTDYVTEA